MATVTRRKPAKKSRAARAPLVVREDCYFLIKMIGFVPTIYDIYTDGLCAMSWAADAPGRYVVAAKVELDVTRSSTLEDLQDPSVVLSDQKHAVVIVPRPDGWAPKGPHDVPPMVDVIERGSRIDAWGFAGGFNKAEMKEQAGAWAIVTMPKATKSGGAL